VSAKALRAFLVGDRGYFVRELQLEPWQDSPLVNRMVCTQGHPIASEDFEGCGCHDQHMAWALRQRIVAAIERRGRFRWANLRSGDDAAAVAAWAGLASVAAAVGVSEAMWNNLFTRGER
jgi:hypothetical protein